MAGVSPAVDSMAFGNTYAGGYGFMGIAGTLLIAKAPGWISDSTALLQHVQNSAAPVQSSLRTIANALAKNILLEQKYHADSAVMATPLRVDICAGSTVRFKMGGTGVFGIGETDADVLCDGYVMQARYTYNTSNATALSQFTIGYMRPVKDYDTLDSKEWNDMPFYAGEPFTAAPWTKEVFDLT